MALLAFGKLNISTAIRKLFLLYGQSLKPSCKKILETFKSLLIIFRASFGRTPNISWKKPKIGHHISNISNLSCQNLILIEPQKSLL